MNIYRYIILFLVFSFLNLLSNENFQKSSSFEGLHFYVGYIQNEFYTIDPSRGKELKIFIATKQHSNISIRYPGETNPTKYSLPADSVMVIQVPQIIESTVSESITDKIVEISSDAPITAYAFSSQPRTSDSYSVVPIASWGKEYVVMSYPNDQYSLDSPPANKQDSIRLLTPRTSEFMIMSAYNNTTVTITPKAQTKNGKPADQNFDITLNKGQCYFVQSYPHGLGQGDLTGTKIISDKPVGLICGHQRTSVPIALDPQYDTKDHLVEMVTPVESWGQKYISVPFNISPEGDLFRITASEPGTSINVKYGSADFNYDLNSDQLMKEFRGLDQPIIWTANKPVQIAQFMMRTNNPDRNDLFDPSMVMLSPVEQFVSRVIFHTPGNVFFNPEQYVEHYVTVIAEKEALDNIKLNGRLLDTTTNISKNQIIGSDYYFTQIELQKGTHKLEAERGKFSGVLFGNGKYDSYSMILGASLTNPDYIDSLAPNVNYDVDCFTINATATDDNMVSASGIYYAFVKEDSTFNFSWNIDEINPDDTQITFSAQPEDIFQDGKIVLEIYDKSGNMRVFEYFHNAVNLDIPSDFIFNSVNWKDSVCFDYNITNLGVDPLELLEVKYIGDDRIQLYNEKPLSEILDQNESFNFKICIDPDQDSSEISGTFVVKFECGLEYSFPVYAGFSAPDFEVNNIDFGDVLVGLDSCYSLQIVNTGNKTITIESFDEIGDNIHFNYDDLILPYDLKPNDDLIIEICFIPLEIGDFKLNLEIKNNYNLSRTAILTGTGIAPNIDNVSIDFGKIRVGRNVPNTLIITNDGNADATLSFSHFITQTKIDDMSILLESITDASIRAGEQYTDNFIFSTEDTLDYMLLAEYETDWENHHPVTIEIKAKGTIPVIETNNVDFGNVKVYDNVNNNFTIINSTGNEDLYIKDAYIISGDQDVFDIDITAFNDITIPINSDMSIPISFNPTKTGEFELKIGINNDAYPDYKIEADTLIITGIGVPELEPDIRFTEEHDEFKYCQTGSIFAKIQNHGDLPIDITDIYLIDNNNGNAQITDQSEDLPFKLSSLESIDITIQTLVQRPDNIDLSLIVETFNTVKDTFDILIVPIEESLIFNNISDIEVTPGDTFKIEFSGSFPYNTENEDIFEIQIEVPSNYWKVIDNDYNMIISGDENLTLPVSIEQNYEMIKIFSNNSFFVPENCTWKISLEILPLLEKDAETEINIKTQFNECFIEKNENFLSKIANVCVFDLRVTKFNSNFIEAKISQNPVSDILNFEVNVKDVQKIDISLFDMSGRNIKLEEGVLVNSGLNYFDYPLDNIANGVYVLSIKNNFMIKNLIIVVNK